MRMKRCAVLFIILFCVSSMAAFAEMDYNAVLLIDEFDDETTDNLLGGETQGDEESEGGCIPLFTQDLENTFGLFGHSLHLEYDVTFPGTFSFYTTKLGPQGADPFTSKARDLSEYTYVSFWYKTEMKKPNFSIEVHRDGDSDGQFILGKDSSSKVVLKKYLRNHAPGMWHKVVVPLTAFNELSRWDNIVELVFVFENALHSDSGIIYFDNILLGTNYPEDEKTDLFSFPGSMRSNVLMINGEKVLSAALVQENNTIDLLLNNLHPFLEQVNVEMYDRVTKKWVSILSFFDHATGMYSGAWQVDPLKNGKGKLRVVVIDVFGNHVILSDTVSFEYLAE